MAIATIHYLHGVNFPGGQFLSQLGEANPQTNLDELVAYGSGHPDPLFTGTRGSKLDIPINTTQIKTLLDLCSTTFVADLSGGNTDLYYKKATDLGVREAAASVVHTRMRMAQAVVYWDQVQADHQQDATISGRIVPTWDGTNALLVPAGSLALTGTPLAAEQYTLGPVKINGANLNGVARWSLNLGIRAKEAGSEGEDAITFFGIEERKPILEIQCDEISTWATYALAGTALTSLDFYLRAKSADGVNVPNGTAGHIKFSATNGRITVVNTTGGGNNAARTTLRIHLRPANSAAAVLTFNSAIAIT